MGGGLAGSNPTLSATYKHFHWVICTVHNSTPQVTPHVESTPGAPIFRVREILSTHGHLARTHDAATAARAARRAARSVLALRRGESRVITCGLLRGRDGRRGARRLQRRGHPAHGIIEKGFTELPLMGPSRGRCRPFDTGKVFWWRERA